MDDRTHRAALRVEGRSAAPGIALGPLLRLTPRAGNASLALRGGRTTGAADALEASRPILSGSPAREDEDAEAILSFQIALLEDENLAAPAFALIAGRGRHGSRPGLPLSIRRSRPMMQADDPYFRARASDLRDLRDRVLRHLAGESDQSVPSGVIVAAEDMPPSMFLATDWRDGGLVLRRGSPKPCRHPRAIARRADDCRCRYRSSRDGVDALLDGEAGS